MENDNFFTVVEEESEKENTKEIKEEYSETPFVTGLPDWDLAPPYETLKRSDS